VKRVLYLLTAALVGMLIVVPAAMAQEMEAEVKTEETMMMETTQPLPKSGGVPVGSVLLPAGALLLGGGVLAVAVLRRR
jgi:hypothetical protein